MVTSLARFKTYDRCTAMDQLNHLIENEKLLIFPDSCQNTKENSLK